MGGLRVLKYIIADDEKMIRIGLRLMLEDLGLPVECIGEASDGEELLKLLNIIKPDICFIDIKMPNMDGLSAIEKAKANLPNTYWVILTGFADFNYAKRAITLGVTDYLVKPTDPAELQKVIEKIIREIDRKEKKREEILLLSTNKTLKEGANLVQEIKDFVHQNYMYDIGLIDIANKYDMTPTYVSRIFHKGSGIKFIDYLIKVRMKNAKRIIEINPSISIREVSEMVGYYSTRHFTKKFFEIYGHNPSDLKEQVKKD